MPRVIANLPVGTKVIDPGSSFYGKPIVWKIIGSNHPGYPSDSVTLISDRVLSLRAFDAREQNNPNPAVSLGGSNRYSQSNIRQWLNGTGPAWYNEQHDYDQAPLTTNVENAQNSYAVQPGFLSSLSANMKTALKPTQVTTSKNTVTAGGGTEVTTDSVFLLSKTEVGLINEGGIPEGTPFEYFAAAGQRPARPTAEAIINSEYYTESLSSLANWMYWLRTPVATTADQMNAFGMAGVGMTAFASRVGVRPALNIKSTSYVADEPNEYGEYTIMFNAESLLRIELTGSFPNFTCISRNTSPVLQFTVKLNGALIESISNPTFPRPFTVRADQLVEGRNVLEVSTKDNRMLNNTLKTYLNKTYQAFPETQFHKSLGVLGETDEALFTLKRTSADSAGSLHRILGGIG